MSRQKFFSFFFAIQLAVGILFPTMFVFAANVCTCYGTDADCVSVPATATKDQKAKCDTACKTKLAKTYASSIYGDATTSDAVTFKCKAAHEAFKAKTAASTDSGTTDSTKSYDSPSLSVDIPNALFTKANSSPCSFDPNQTCVKSNYLADYLNGLYSFLITIGVTIAIVMVMVGGLQYTLGAGGKELIDKGKKRIQNAVTGLLLLLCVFLVLQSVNPQLDLLKTIELQNVPPEGLGNNDVTDASDEKASYPNVAVTAGQLPQFKQCDSKWKGPYKGKAGAAVMCGPNKHSTTDHEDNICESGCGPTSTAVVLGYYGQNVSPPAVAAVASKLGAHVTCASGTAINTVCKKVSSEWPGMKCKSIPQGDAAGIAKILQQKKPIVFSCHSCTGKLKDGSDKSYKGHYMVLTGVAGTNFTVFDVGRQNGIVTIPMSEFTSGKVASTYLIEKN